MILQATFATEPVAVAVSLLIGVILAVALLRAHLSLFFAPAPASARPSELAVNERVSLLFLFAWLVALGFAF